MTLSELLPGERLAQGLCSVLEQAAFVFAETLDDGDGPAPWSSDDLLRVRLEIGVEAEQGALWLQCEKDAGISLAANLLGIEMDDEQARQKAQDASGELLNIVCGTLLEQVCGSELEYRLGTPEISGCKANASSDLPGTQLSLARLSTEDGHIMELQLRTT